VKVQPMQPTTVKEDSPTGPTSAQSLADRYSAVRNFTESLCEPLEIEDYVIQSMPDASPARWHLAHTTWFFETLVVSRFDESYRSYDAEFAVLFNSYYNTIGPQFPRARRGTLSRPTIKQVYRYRRHIDDRMLDLLTSERLPETLTQVVEVGLNHEQQHQELILTDIKHAFGSNPLRPAYRAAESLQNGEAPPVKWIAVPEGIRSIGHQGAEFAYDNETPRHPVFVNACQIASRLVTNGEFLNFMEDDAYDRPELWLSDGWDARQANQWTAPLYWEKRDDAWWTMTLSGMREIDREEPVCHVSFYEADAYARWQRAWLPLEVAWEVAAEKASDEGNFVESGHLHPTVASVPESENRLTQMLGDVWEWTASPYVPYPGYRAPKGPLGEYNAKFMANRMVLRGGSCATSRTHIRRTYRNFFPPDARWQFSGFRLAREVLS